MRITNLARFSMFLTYIVFIIREEVCVYEIYSRCEYYYFSFYVLQRFVRLFEEKEPLAR